MMDLGNTFRRIANVLDESKTRYMLVGSFASSFYEALRGTQDVDIVIAPGQEQFERLLLHLKQSGYYTDSCALTAFREQSMFNALDNETGWKIDFIFCKLRAYDQEAFRRRKETVFQGVPFFIAAAEDVILGKLEWTKMGEFHRQLEDASIVLKKNRELLDFQYMERWSKNWELRSSSAMPAKQPACTSNTSRDILLGFTLQGGSLWLHPQSVMQKKISSDFWAS